MDELLTLLSVAWNDTVKPLIARDPAELSRRLARRQSGMLRRPPRAWCVALRAADQRINSFHAACVPEEYYWPRSSTRRDDRAIAHEVLVDAKLVRRVARPIALEAPMPMEQITKLLGLSRGSIKSMTKRGVFEVSYIQNWQGRRGRPVPFYFTRKMLDPCRGRGREMIDPIWGSSHRYIADHVPADLQQTLTRVPHFIPKSGRKCLMGWHWVCPKCDRRVRMIYYPMCAAMGTRFIEGALKSIGVDPSTIASPSSSTSFACMWCHNVMQNSRVLPDNWNRLVSHLSGGLLYGADVRKPAWFTRERKVAFHPILNRPPSKRRELILRDIAAGLSYRQIMQKQGIAKSTVSMQAAIIYRQHRVKGAAALRELMRRRTVRHGDARGAESSGHVYR